MGLMIVILIIILMYHLNQKGKAYREHRRRQQRYIQRVSKRKAITPTEKQIKDRIKKTQEAKYRKELEEQGYNEELITTILPTITDGE